MVLPRPVYLTRPGKFVVGSRTGRILDVADPEYPHPVSVVPRSVDTPSRLDRLNHAGHSTIDVLSIAPPPHLSHNPTFLKSLCRPAPIV